MLRHVLITLLVAQAMAPMVAALTEPNLARVSGAADPERRILAGFPLKDDLRLIVILNGQYRGTTALLDRKEVVVRSVESPNDLRGKVQIETAQQALAFSRLFTATDTCEVGFVRDTGAEVIRALEVVTRSQAPNRRWGVLDDAIAQRFHLKPATVGWRKDHWVVERNLVIIGWVKNGVYQNGGVDNVYRSQESIYPDGRYTYRNGPVVEGDLDSHMDLPGPMY
jgi:hypothetical protein